MQYAAFLRNVNLGQRNSPSREQLEAAFLAAGASTAASFLSNGTLVFNAADEYTARRIADQAGETLDRVCGLHEPVFVRPFERLAGLVAEDPFTAYAGLQAAEYSISFFEPGRAAKIEAPIESARKDCLVFRIEAGDALSVSRPVDGHTGYPTPVLEKALGVPVTTRGWRTIQRLVAKLS